MAVPTANELYDFYTELCTVYEDTIWALDTLVEEARRKFRSTTPAVMKRTKPLIANGRLKPLRIDNTGLVLWPEKENGVRDIDLPFCYLDLGPSKNRHGMSFGTIVLSDGRTDKLNLWANGVRTYYTLDTEYDKIVPKFKAVKDKEIADFKARRYQEKLEVKAALEAAAPQGDGLGLVNRLAKVLGSRSSRVDARMFSSMSRPEDPAELHIDVSIRAENLPVFLEILRSGLPEAEEPVTDNVVVLPKPRKGGED